MKNLINITFNKLNLFHFWWKLILLFLLVSSSLYAASDGSDVYVYLIILPIFGVFSIFLLSTPFFVIYNIAQKNFQRKTTALISLVISSFFLSIILFMATDSSEYKDEMWPTAFVFILLFYSINTYYYLKCIDFSKNTTITKKGFAIAVIIPFLVLSIVRCSSLVSGTSTEEKYSIIYYDTIEAFTTKNHILALPLYIITDTISLPITGTVTLYRHYKFSKVNKIFQPVKENNTSKMADLISKGTNINFTNSSNETLLVKAISLNHYDMVRFLLDQGADINLDAGSGTPLSRSLALEDHKIFDLLLERNVDYNLKTANSELAIIRAIELNNEYYTKELLKKYKDINSIKDNEKNLLTIALRRSDINPNIIRILLEQGIDLESKDYALSIFDAIDLKNIKVINLLLDNKADINKQNDDGETVLMRSVSTSYGEENIVSLLLKRGADKNLKNKEGKTAQQLAIELGYNNIAELLK